MRESLCSRQCSSWSPGADSVEQHRDELLGQLLWTDLTAGLEPQIRVVEHPEHALHGEATARIQGPLVASSPYRELPVRLVLLPCRDDPVASVVTQSAVVTEEHGP